MASRTTSIGQRWRAVTWPNSLPPLPEGGFAGPYGIWEDDGPGGVFMSYEFAEHNGYFEDVRLRRPPLRTGESEWSANERRYGRWQREYHADRGETYLTLVELDLTSEAEILEWVSTFGVLDIRALDMPATDRQWFGAAAPRPIPLRALAHYPGFGIGVRLSARHRIGAPDSELRERAVERCKRERAALDDWRIEETLQEFIYGAWAVRDLHTACACLRDGRDPREQTWANERMPAPDWTESRAIEDTAAFVEGTLNVVLERFSPRIYLRDEDGQRTFRGPSGSPAPADVTTFELLMLEIFRHIVEDASYKRCENANCRRLFVRQEGGSVHGQSRRTGVKYCSRHCAKAAAQRAHRRRQSAIGAATDRHDDPPAATA